MNEKEEDKEELRILKESLQGYHRILELLNRQDKFGIPKGFSDSKENIKHYIEELEDRIGLLESKNK